ncbi:hypothetical protein SDC9_135294 [bioreactor metagenome]|uniref:Uncharacterized protein n=1 Tax=bioreactor metagenome TaxID=1076179 RepID=A0A645DH91_9ZZZZ
MKLGEHGGDVIKGTGEEAGVDEETGNLANGQPALNGSDAADDTHGCIGKVVDQPR